MKAPEMKSIFHTSLMLMLLAVASVVSATSSGQESTELPEAHQVVNEVTGQVFTLIRETQQRDEIDLESFKGEVYKILNPRLDWTGFSRGVMGAYYASASEEQRAIFVESVRSMLLEFYAAAMLKLRDQELHVLPPSEPPSNPNRVNVDLEFVAEDGSVIPIVFNMRKIPEDGAWRLVNLNLSGINLGLTWRSQFGRIMDTTGDIDQAIVEFAEAVEAASPGPSTTGD